MARLNLCPEDHMRVKSALLSLMLGSSSLIAVHSMAAPSSALTTICANAFGVVQQEGPPAIYVESLTLQDMETKVEFSDKTSYNIWPNGFSGTQGGQADQIRSMMRFAYLTRTPVNICTGMGAIWAVELDKDKRRPYYQTLPTE
jgi:hypothetical protein